MKTFSLAWRNLLRNRRRSITTLMAMVIGAASILLFGGYARDIAYGLQTGFVQRSGHLQVQRKDFFLNGGGNPGQYGIAAYDKVSATLLGDPVLARMLTVVTPTLQLNGIAGNFSEGVSRNVLGSGVVVADQNRLRQWNDYQFPLVITPLALTGTGPDAAIIGVGLARTLNLCGPLKIDNCGRRPAQAAPADAPAIPGDVAALSNLETPTRPATPDDTRVEILAANVHGAPNVAAVRVAKAETQGVKELDDVYIGLHLAYAQRLIFGRAQPQVTALIVQLRHTSQIPAARARIEELLQGPLKDMDLEVHDFMKLNPIYEQSLTMFRAIFLFIAVLIAAIVLFTVGNTMSMAVVERTSEIGTLRAMGLRRAAVRRMFVCEGLLLGLVGAVLGVLASLLLAYLVNHSGLSYTPPGWVRTVPLTIHLWGETGLMVTVAAALSVVASISAWWPARRASRMVIVDALRHV